MPIWVSFYTHLDCEIKVCIIKTYHPLLARVHIILCKCDKNVLLVLNGFNTHSKFEFAVIMVRFKTFIDTGLITNVLQVFKIL